MRLIDADAIQYTHAIARALDDGHNWNELCVTQDEIEDMPTIQLEPPRIRGHWNKKMSIRHINNAVCYIPKWHCPNCDLEYDPAFAQRVNFCYKCGQWIEGLVDVVNEVTE